MEGIQLVAALLRLSVKSLPSLSAYVWCGIGWGCGGLQVCTWAGLCARVRNGVNLEGAGAGYACLREFRV